LYYFHIVSISKDSMYLIRYFTLQKFIIIICILTYKLRADSIDEYIQIGEHRQITLKYMLG